MTKTTLHKDIRRTITKNLSRFLAIAVMAGLGIGVFSGFSTGCLDSLKAADRFYDAQNTYDIQIVSTLGLTQGDASAAAGVDGVGAVYGSHSMDVKIMQSGGTLKLATLTALDDRGMNQPYVLEGTLPQKSGQLAVNSKFLKDTGLHVGDTVTLSAAESQKADAKDTAAAEGSDKTNNDLKITVDSDSSAPALAVTQYKITAVILSPLKISADKSPTSVSSTSSSGDYLLYATGDCIIGSVYNALYLTLDGASKLDCYSKDYQKLAETVIARIKSTIQSSRQQARHDDLVGSANKKISEAEKTLAEEQADALHKLSDAQAEINDGQAQLQAGRAELNRQETAGEQQFASGEQQLAQNKNTLDEQISGANTQLTGVVSALPEEAQKIWNNEATQKLWAAMMSDGTKAAPYLLSTKQGETPTQEETAAYTAAMGALQKDTGSFAAGFGSAGSPLTEEQTKAFSNLAVTQGTLTHSQAQLEQNASALEEQKNAAEAQFSEAQQKLADSETQLKDGQATLDKNKADYEASMADAHQQLAKAKADVANIASAKWYVWDRSHNDSFARFKSDVSFIQAVTTAFPVIFLLVAILISLTTMSRMVEEDRSLIGTYKSLGYSNAEIRMKYILYAVLSCVLGELLGVLIGFVALPKAVGIIVSNMYVLPLFRLEFYSSYALGGFGLFLLGIVGAAVFSCAEMLRQRPAELMRPKAPKAGSRILLERIPFIWKRLNFLNKVTFRNLFRYKKRALMTIVGILGCTMLIVFGFGIRDTVGGLMSDQFGTVTVYDAIVVTNKLDAAEMSALSEEWSAFAKETQQIQLSSMTLQSEKNNTDITVIVVPDDANPETYLHLRDAHTKQAMTLPSNGIVLTQNAAKRLGVARGKTVSLQNSDNLSCDFPVSFVSLNYTGNFIYMRESLYQARFGDYAGNAFLLNLTDNPNGQSWLKALKDDDRILSVSSSQSAIDSFKDVNAIINAVVYALIGLSAVLAVTVLFTLSNINISERERELATIKVLGFQRKEIYSYINKETMILTLSGILCGLPAGYGITYGILASVSIADIAFNVRVTPFAYVIATVLTLVFAILVNNFTNRDLRKINMVEALKSVE